MADKHIVTHGNKYSNVKYKYKYKYKYLKFVLEYYSSTSTSTKYYITAFWTHKVHYQCKLRNFDDGGLLSWWSFVRVVLCPGLALLVVFCPVVFCP